MARNRNPCLPGENLSISCAFRYLSIFVPVCEPSTRCHRFEELHPQFLRFSQIERIVVQNLRQSEQSVDLSICSAEKHPRREKPLVPGDAWTGGKSETIRRVKVWGRARTSNFRPEA